MSGIFILAFANRSSVDDIAFYDSSGATPALDAGDSIRIKIGHAEQTPLIDLSSATPTNNGSSVARANPARLEIDQGDMLPPGTYDIEAAIIDHGDGDRIKLAEQGLFVVGRTQGGAVT